jgi:hypothetical protein
MEAGPGIDTSAGKPAAGRSSLAGNAATLFLSLLISMVFIEIGYRAFEGLPIFKLANWRTERVVMVNLGELKGVADPVLGWTEKPWTSDEDGFTTIEYGVRQNFGETTIRTGGVLAVGDSFTEGWEVKGDESWPAVLEKHTNVPVINAGVGGHGTDQVTLRTEQLLPIVKPRILIFGLHEEMITRAGYSIYGAPKPFFTLEKRELHYHPPQLYLPAVEITTLRSISDRIREAMGYSAALDFILSRLAPNFWHSIGPNDLYETTGEDEAAITCSLLQRLKNETDKGGIKLMLFLQYHAPVIVAKVKESPNLRSVAACAQAAGIRIVDQYDTLRAAVRDTPGPDAIREFYWSYDGVFAHMTAKGNEQAATLLASELRDWLPAPPARAEHDTGAARQP